MFQLFLWLAFHCCCYYNHSKWPVSEDATPLPVKLKCLCSAQRETLTLSTCEWLWEKKEINTSLPEAGPPGHVLQAWWPFLLYLLIAFPSLFCLLTLVARGFSLWSIEEPGIQTWTRWLFWDISLPSSPSASFPKSHIPCLNTLSPIHWPVMKQAERAWTCQQMH